MATEEELLEFLANDRMNEVVRRLKAAGQSTEGIEGDEDSFRLFLALERAVKDRRNADPAEHSSESAHAGVRQEYPATDRGRDWA